MRIARFVMVWGLLLASVGLPAAHGREPGDHGRPENSGSRLRIKDRECVAGCRSVLLACLADARAAAVPCVEACQPKIEAARTACASDPDGEACGAAREAARTCLQACHDTLRPGVRECFAQARDCARACPLLGEPPCLTACRAEHVGCVSDAQSAARTCRAECQDEMQAARAACANPAAVQSEACAQARAALQGCLQPCREAFTQGVAVCNAALRTCVQACASDGGSE